MATLGQADWGGSAVPVSGMWPREGCELERPLRLRSRTQRSWSCPDAPGTPELFTGGHLRVDLAAIGSLQMWELRLWGSEPGPRSHGRKWCGPESRPSGLGTRWEAGSTGKGLRSLEVHLREGEQVAMWGWGGVLSQSTTPGPVAGVRVNRSHTLHTWALTWPTAARESRVLTREAEPWPGPRP